MSLSGLAPNGVYHASAVASACGALLPHLFTLTFALQGGLFSVALSLGLPPLDVIQHSDPVEPGLSSHASMHQQSSSHLTCGCCSGFMNVWSSQAYAQMALKSLMPHVSSQLQAMLLLCSLARLYQCSTYQRCDYKRQGLFQKGSYQRGLFQLMQ